MALQSPVKTREGVVDPRGPETLPVELLEHATRVFALSEPAAILSEVSRTTLQVSNGVGAVGSWGLPGASWGGRVHVVANAAGPVSNVIGSALFAIHRRVAMTRQPATFVRGDGADAILDAIAKEIRTPVDVACAFPMMHRNGRHTGELVIAGVTATFPNAHLVPPLARLASLALENSHRVRFARREQERLNLLAEASDEALWDWDVETGDLWFGGGILKLLGAGTERIHGRLSWKLDRIDPADSERVRASLNRALGDIHVASWVDEYRFVRADGRRIFVEERAYFLREPDGRVYRVVGTMRNISTLKTLLASEKEARTLAETASRAKDEFLAMLGHELRNPLSPIMTALDLLRMRGIGAIERERTVIERQAKHMVRLVDDLLDISRIASGKFKLERIPVDVSDSCAAAIEMIRPLLEERNHELTVSLTPGLVVLGDPARLTQAVSNLLRNAAKYTPPGGQIELGAARSGGEVTIRVVDTGIGIAPEILPRIFEIFVQERQAIDRSQGGLGLGLSIVRSIVSLHGGSVRALSKGQGRGSEFLIRLPLLDGTNDADGQTSGSRDGNDRAKDLRILIVDDNRDAAELLSTYFSQVGHSVRAVHDGEAALRAAEEFLPDIVLLDIGLPLLDGYEVAKRIRAGSGAKIRLIAVTGYGQESDRRKALEASFDAHIVKPVSVELLDETIRKLLAPKIRA